MILRTWRLLPMALLSAYCYCVFGTCSISTTTAPVEWKSPDRQIPKNITCANYSGTVNGNVTFRGLQNKTEDFLHWLLGWGHKSICSFFPKLQGNYNEQHYRYEVANLTYNCTYNQLTLLNLTTENSGKYYFKREDANFTFYYSCYNLTVF
ncbi:envelope glycoprotein UL4 [Human betaherpesvirus 5]|uniref:Envelope glycoprotein UL4 n=1 Tax=Human cytomegalovirus TaxID=10359 RepID=A0A0G2TTA4_HCMV|nr:envelope glycoprotein UL4 [Human betaherpesvirus 5]AQN72489.1 envelope glycoprotein UL4 [Human betaherpesvirus 5]